MALKALMLRKKIDTKTKELEALRALDDEFTKFLEDSFVFLHTFIYECVDIFFEFYELSSYGSVNCGHCASAVCR